jgi:hypothetical protein
LSFFECWHVMMHKVRRKLKADMFGMDWQTAGVAKAVLLLVSKNYSRIYRLHLFRRLALCNNLDSQAPRLLHGPISERPIYPRQLVITK